MSAREDIRERAELFGWEARESTDRLEIYWRGNYAINVQYRRDGVVEAASEYIFGARNSKPILVESAVDSHKKPKVISWLAA